MGKINNGILGGVSGKVGSVVGANWKGIAYIRSLAQHVSNPNTDAQQMWRFRMGTLSTLGAKLLSFLQLGFHNLAVDMTEANVFIKRNIKAVFSGTWPTQTLDYTKLSLAAGSLDMAVNPSVSVSGNALSFAWTDNSGVGTAKGTDKLCVVVYNTLKGQSLVMIDVAVRSAATYSLSCPTVWSGDSVEVYIMFRNEDERTNTNSLYLGSISL